MAAAKSAKKATTSSKTKVAAKSTAKPKTGKATKKTTPKSTTTKKSTTNAKASTKTKKSTAKKSTAKKSTVKKTAPKKTAAKKTAAKKTTKPSKASKTKNVDFISDIIKQSAKAQKTVSTQIKGLIKELNTLDKTQAQLVKKQSTAKGKSWQSLENKVAKLKPQITATRTSLLNCENTADKIATLTELAQKLNSRPTPSAYTPSSPTSSKPTLVKSKSSSSSKSAPTYGRPSSSSSNKPTPIQSDDDYADIDELDLEQEELGFSFDDDEALDDEMGR